MKLWIVLVTLLTLLAGSACAHPPPTVSPAASLAANEIRLVQSLDLLRNVALDANTQNPPILSTASARQVVLYHESVLLLLQAAPLGWVSTANAGLTALLQHFSGPEQIVMGPYIAVIRMLLQVFA